jgi:hypothetical protein
MVVVRVWRCCGEPFWFHILAAKDLQIEVVAGWGACP